MITRQRQNDRNDDIFSNRTLNVINTCERRLKESMYRKVSKLNITVWVTPEPVPFSERKSGKKKCLDAGDAWGELWDCGWFLLEDKIPDLAENEQVVLRLDISGEACVFDCAGNPQKGLTNVRSRNVERLGNFGKTVYHLDREVQGQNQVSLWIEGGCNDLFGDFCDGGRVLLADICEQTVTLNMNPFEIKTLCLSLKQ